MEKILEGKNKATTKTLKIILETIRSGASQRDASALAGISEDTPSLWKRDSDFSEQMRQKEIEYKMDHIGSARFSLAQPLGSPGRDIDPYRISTPFGDFVSFLTKSAQKVFDSYTRESVVTQPVSRLDNLFRPSQIMLNRASIPTRKSPRLTRCRQIKNHSKCCDF